MDRYDVVEQIGKGTYSSVYKAIDKTKSPSNNIQCLNSASLVAIKVMQSESIDFEDYNKEVEVLSNLDHPNLLKYIENFEIGNDENKFESGNKQDNDAGFKRNHIFCSNSHCIVTEYIDGVDLLTYLNTNGPFQERQAKRMMAELLSAILYLHSNHILHRDLKLENIMVTKDLHVKIIDFGFSCKSEENGGMRTTLCGSVAYCSPEILLNIPYNFACDIWSLGIVFYAMVVQQLPYWDDNISLLAKKILELSPTYPLFVSKDCQSFINSMLEKNQNQRPTIQQIVNHPFISFEFSSYQTFLTKRNDQKESENNSPFPKPVFLNSIHSREPRSIIFLNFNTTESVDDPNELIPQKRIKIQPKGSYPGNNILKRFSMTNVLAPNQSTKNASPGIDYLAAKRKRRRTFAQVHFLQQKHDQMNKAAALPDSNVAEPLQPLYKKNNVLSPQSALNNGSPK